MRSHNTALLLHLAWQAGEISRADLVRETGLAPSTVSGVVSELIERGLMRESHAARTTGGRPPIVLRFDEERFHLLGVDLGATHISLALTNLRAQIVAWRTVDHPVRSDPHGALERVVALVGEVLAETGVGLDAVLGLGLGVPSPVDPARPDNLSPRILPAWEGVHPAAWLAERLQIPVRVDNDANLCALAEAWHGAGKEQPSVAYIKLGTGVGAGFILHGDILHGANGFAGEIGHTAIDSSGPQCSCGLRGCLQTLVGSAAVIERAGPDPKGKPRSLAQVARAAALGEPAALDAVQHAGRHLGAAIANLFNLLNPSVVVLGGGLTAAGEPLLQALRESVRERPLWAALASADVVLSELGDRTAALGAATLLLQAVLHEPDAFLAPTPALQAGSTDSARRVRA